MGGPGEVATEPRLQEMEGAVTSRQSLELLSFCFRRDAWWVVGRLSPWGAGWSSSAS